MGAVIESGCTGSILVVAPKTAVYVTGRTNWSVGLPTLQPGDEWVIVGGKQTKLERIQSLKQRILRFGI